MRDRAKSMLCPREKTGAVRCPGHCACIDVPGDPEPHRYLSETPGVDLVIFNAGRLTWSTQVDFCARNLPLTTLAAFLASAFPGQVYVPGAKVYAKLWIDLDGATLAQVATASGLLLKEPQGDAVEPDATAGAASGASRSA